MGVSSLDAGSLVLLNGVPHQLIRKVTGSCWQLQDTRNKRIVEIDRELLERKYSIGELVFPQNKEGEGTATTILDELSAEKWEVLKIRRLYVHAVLNVPSSKDSLRPFISSVWSSLGRPGTQPGWCTVLRWKNRYISSGNDIHSLRDRDGMKGNRNSRYPSETQECCDKAIRSVYLTRERRTIQDTIDHAVFLVKEENKLRPEGAQLKIPNRRYMARLINKLPAFDKYAARFGYQSALRRFRYVGGHRFSKGPLDRAEIDHTILDLFVVDDESCLPLGRLYVTCCVDDYTRCVLGLHIGFTPPSFQSVASCLKHAFLPKSTLLEKYLNIKHSWAAYGVMGELAVDNGAEFHSSSLEQCCYSLGIVLHYAPRKTPWFKGKIERFLGTLNKVVHGIPGTTFANIVERDDYHPEKHAVIRFSTLCMILNLWIADVYHQKPHRTLGVSPAQMWASSISLDQIRFAENPALLDVIMGVHHERVLTHKGIEFERLVYNSPELHDLCRRFGHGIDVTLRVNEDDIGHVYVIHPQAPQPIKVPALRLDYANGISLWQHRVIRRYQLKQGHLLDEANGWLEAKEEIANIIAEELQLKRTTSHKRIARFKQKSKDVALQYGDNTGTAPGTQASTLTRLASVNAQAPVLLVDELQKDVQPFALIIQDRSKG